MYDNDTTVMILNNKNKVFEYHNTTIEQALDSYVTSTLCFNKGFLMDEITWKAVISTEQRIYTLVILINSLCKKYPSMISRVLTKGDRIHPINSYLNGIFYSLSIDGTYAEVTGYSSTLQEKVEIKNKFDGISVTHIGNNAFTGCATLKQLIIPNSITEIAEDAFSDCENLTDIYYCGTEQDWTSKFGSEYIPGVTIHPNYTADSSI